jgi:hypothetical protein
MKRIWHAIQPFLAGILVLIALLALILVPAYSTTSEVALTFRSLQGAATNVTTSEQTTGGPLPGDLSKYESEQSCQEGISTPGYWSSMNAAELTDGQRSGIYPCTDFLGSFTEKNIVYTYKAEGNYPNVYYVNNDGPNGMYVVGGAPPPSTGPSIPTGPFVARIDPITGAQVWRTYVENLNVDSNTFIGGTNLNILANGYIVFAWDHRIVLLDRDTGAIVKERDLPTPGLIPGSVNYKELTVAPDGTIILRSQNRPDNCNQQGGGGLEGCSQSAGGPELKPSAMLAINPDTLQVYDSLLMPEDSATPTLIADYQGKIAIYSAMQEHATRVFCDAPTYMAIGSSSKPTGSAAARRRRRWSPSTSTTLPTSRPSSRSGNFSPARRATPPRSQRGSGEQHGLLGRRRARQDRGRPPRPNDREDDDEVEGRRSQLRVPAAVRTGRSPDPDNDEVEPGCPAGRDRHWQLHPADRLARRRNRQGTGGVRLPAADRVQWARGSHVWRPMALSRPIVGIALLPPGDAGLVPAASSDDNGRLLHLLGVGQRFLVRVSPGQVRPWPLWATGRTSRPPAIGERLETLGP